MCGIFCTICDSADEAQSRRTIIAEKVMPFLLRRGPDYYGEKKIHCSPSSNGCGVIHLTAVVLHLRGECIAKQPVEDSYGNILAWNGEIFDGLEVAAHESDTTALLRNLSTSENNHIESILKTMSRVRGPWAFVYYQAKQNTLWFGRDYFGRRSLLWHLPSSPTDLFALSSVGTRSTEDMEEQFWQEVPASGIYSVDIKKVNDYFFKGDEIAVEFQAILQRHPWQKYSSEYPIGPVRNQFNRELSNHGVCLTFDAFQKDGKASTKSKENSVYYAQNRYSDDSYSLQKDTACNSHGMSTDVANCCQLNAARYQGIKVHRYSDRSEKQNVLLCPAKEDGVRSARIPDDMIHSSEVALATEDAGDICKQPNNTFSLGEKTNQYLDEEMVKEHINEDVVEQFANVLMEAVRRRVFNLPRRTITETCILTGKIQDNISVDKKEKAVGVENRGSNVGILFSGGLDSIVLAALADKCIPFGEPIDLINVAFEKRSAGKKEKQKTKQRNHKNQNDEKMCDSNFKVPDRITGRNGVVELKQINPKRPWNFVEVNVTLDELQKERSKYVTHLVSPQSTVLDDSIGCALWFAARGQGILMCSQCVEDIKEPSLSCGCRPSYTCPAKVLLVGMGADEQLGGYARHRSRFNKEGWKGLVDEIEMEVNRISERNLGRDDRCISDHGRECRYPFLDEDVVSFLNALPVWIKCDPRLPRGIGEKILLRQVAKSLGLTGSSELPKRAIQFGSRIAKLESSSEKGSEKCSRF